MVQVYFLSFILGGVEYIAVTVQLTWSTLVAESKTPLITATPPTPTPEEFIRRQREDLNHRNEQIRLDRRHRSNTNPDNHHMEPRSITHSENVKRHSQPVGDELPPYPVTPPGSEVNISTDYMTHTRRQRAATAPPVPLFNPPMIDRRESKGFRTSAVELPAREVRSSGRKGYEELYHTLRTFSTIFLIDDSPSMIHHWSSTRVAFENLATTALQYITDGVEVAFLNDYIAERNITRVYTKEDVRKCFEDTVLKGVTPIGDALDGVLKEYIDGYVEAKAAWSSPRLLSGDRFGNEGPTTTTTNHTRKRPKPLNIVILTDGIPTDDVESVIVSNARLLDSLNAPLSQVGIQFVQIGNEEGVREELKDLDDYIANVYGIRDMVDTTPYVEGDMGEGDWLQKALLGGVNRRVDKMG